MGGLEVGVLSEESGFEKEGREGRNEELGKEGSCWGAKIPTLGC